MIHGFTGTPWIFNDLKTTLNRRGILVSTPLLPGHGTQPSDLNRVRWQEWVACGRNAYENLKRTCDSVFILGLSMGGAISLYLAGDTNCAGVITLSAPVRFKKPWVYALPLIRLFLKTWRKRGVVPGSKDLEEQGYACYPLSALNQFVRMLRQVRRKLKKIRCPALILHAKMDKKIPSANAEKIFRGIHSMQRRFRLLEHPCHVITKGEDREIVEREVVQFILEQLENKKPKTLIKSKK
jgi:carboxylesterase